jgi:beta-phosphoglucomutase-like phosphatase (HAD superfamily)
MRANVDALTSHTLGAAIMNWFDVVATGDVDVTKNLAPDVYIRVLERLCLQPHQAAALEDSLNGLASAKAAGLSTVPTIWNVAENLSAADLGLASLSDEGTLQMLSSLHSRWILDRLEAAR